MANQVTQTQVQNVPTFVAAIVTGLALPIATIFVAFISRRGDKRTTKSDRVPEVIKVLQDHIDANDQQIIKLVEDRDAWRNIAWRQLQESELETEDAFVSPKHGRQA